MKDNPKVESNHDGTEEASTLEVLVSVPDKKIQKLYHFDVHDKVWTAKLQVINELIKGVKDAVNYGFYDPPYNGKSGKFLEEERAFSDYPLPGSPPSLEFKLKRRIYRSVVYEQKTLQKVNAKTNQRKFMELVTSSAVSQVAKMAERGLDPNFHDDRTGDTPLSLAVTKDNASDLIIALVNGGALLDYRTREGLTPLHRAAASGKAISVKTLLDFGASPNYKDLKGLTPLFHTVVHKGDPYCSEILLNDHAELHISDHQGMQEIHLACKNGLVQHLEHLLYYGAEINARTASGNTALHVAALNNQDECTRVLLFRGAKRNILNFANQSAYEVAAVSGNKELAELIRNFRDGDIVKLSGKPTYSTRRRKSVSKPKASSLFPRTSSEPQLSVQSDSTPPSPVSSTHSVPSTTASETASADEHNITMNGEIETHKHSKKDLNRTLSMSSTASDTSGSESDSGELSPRDEKRKKRSWQHYSMPNITDKPVAPPVKVVSGAATIRKRLYASVPGKRFVAVRDYRPLMAGELALEKGDEVEVLYVGEKGYWEGRVGNSTGWFHHSYVQEKKGKNKSRPKTLFGRPPSSIKSDFQDMNHIGLKSSAEAPRMVTLQRSSAGFGFQMRGANSQVPRLNFVPTPEFPALQYFGELEKGGQADVQGVKTGDFILEVNGEDVTTATHGHVVELIKMSGNAVTLKIVTVKNPSVNGTDHADGKGQGFKLPPPPPNRDPSTTLTLGRMTTLSSSRPSLFEMSMGESFEEPANYRVDSVIAVSKENRWHSLQRQKPQARKPVGVQMKGHNIVKRNSSGDLRRDAKPGYQRAQSMQSMLPPSYESVVGKRPLSAAVPVAMPVVPGEARLPRSMSEDNTALSKYAATSKSTPNLDHHINNDPDLINGHGSPPSEASRDMAHNIPFSYATLDRNKPRSTSSSNVETVVATPVKATVVAVESTEAKSEVTVVATAVEVVESSPAVETTTSRVPSVDATVVNKADKPPVPPKPPSLSDALQEAVAARAQRMSRKTSAPEIQSPSAFKQMEPRERKASAPSKFSPRKRVESSEKVRSEIMTCLEEQFVEDDSKAERSSSVVKQNERFNTLPRTQEKQKRNSDSSPEQNPGLVLASSADIYRRYTSPTRDMNRQSSLDSNSSGTERKSSVLGNDKFRRQLSEPVSLDRQPAAQAIAKPPRAPIPPPQLTVRASPAVPPPPTLPTTKKTDIPATPVTKGLITADALSAKKSKLKSAPKDNASPSKATSPVRKTSAPASGGTHSFATQHTNLLAKAVAARAARISTQSHSDTDLTKQDVKTGEERQLYSPERNNNRIKPQVVEARAVNSRGKPTPPVAPKKRLSSPDLKQRRQRGDEFIEQRKLSGGHSPGRMAERSLPFDIPPPVLSEEDRSVMLLDEVIRKEAESENWSLNSWNSGSDSSTEIYVPPPVWPAPDQHELNAENTLKPWYECSSQSEESIPNKTAEPEKFNKTIVTKKGFQIKLTFESKKKEDPPKQERTSSQTDYNDIDAVEPLTPKLRDSPRTDVISRTDSHKEILLEKAGLLEPNINDELQTPVPEKTNGINSFELPPPPLLFTDSADESMPLDSPPLPPPPEFSPKELKAPVFYPKEERESISSPSPSAGSDDSSKEGMTYTDISSIFSGYSRPMEAYMDRPVLDWSCDDVCNWLDSINMSQYKDTFRENDIQGAHLPDLTKAELRELGVKSLGHRMTMENAIARLSQPLESNC